MSLKEYVRKRNFEVTPEPKPEKISPPASQGRFFIQRHHASHLHYDFRLEIGGTLKSWAIPKGPTLDPAPKRFAAMVEDHPIDYGDFEGNIPAGNYGGGSVMLWDHGTFDLLGDTPALKQIERGDLKFRLHGQKLQGEFALVHMRGKGKGNEWLLLKKKDAEARPGWDVEDAAFSVKTGRTQEEIARDLPARAPAKKVVQVVSPTRARAKRTKPVTKSASKSDDEAPAPGAVKAPMPDAVTPMGASLTSTLPRGPDWVTEVKWDGIRALCFLNDGDLRIFSRRGNRCERQYPELSVLPHYVSARQAILDGEIAVLDPRGASSFSLIQPRITNQDANAMAQMARKNPVNLFLFDLLYVDGWDLRKCTLLERKRLLREVLQPHPLLRYSDHFSNDVQELLEAARQNGLEGLVAKCATSIYEPRRSRDWLKLKLISQQEFVICGYTAGERDFFGALILGIYEKGKLVHAGNVGTGFDNKMLAAVHERLARLETSKPAFALRTKVPQKVIWVRPELVCEVKFSSWTHDNNLRAPVFLGLRPDVDPKECVRESDVEVEEQTPESRPALFPADKDEVIATIGTRRLKFTNLNKIYYPADGYTKRDLLNYYDAVADLLLPYLKDRPLSLKRYPNGIDQPYFFQKDSPESYPDWLRYETIEGVRYVLAEERAALLYLTNLGCIDQNPWMSRAESLENPDFLLIDLDPQGCEFDKIIEAAQWVRKKLDAVGLEGYPKTTGGDGMHIYVPLAPHYTYDEARSFAQILAGMVAGERPDLFTTPRPVQKRERGKVYFDYLQIGFGKTIAAPYVVRAYPGAPVATPLAWHEVEPGLTPARFTLKNATQRFERVGDLFDGVLTKPQTLEEPFAKLEKILVG